MQATAVSSEVAQQRAEFQKAVNQALSFAGLKGSDNLKKAAEQSMIAARIMRAHGLKFYPDVPTRTLSVLKSEWGFCVSAYKWDSTRKDAFDRANELFRQIKLIEGEKTVEGKKKEPAKTSV